MIFEKKNDNYRRYQKTLQDLYRGDAAEKEIFQRICPVCGETFYSTERVRQKYCTLECRETAYKKGKEAVSTIAEK